ncbi:MAG: DUF167 domain-containing protein [Candidatus Kerfeldbacteria bacterium]|nr:DUF167 domain-containing protein [Candidatus Kerfeldbacteria bacterium]
MCRLKVRVTANSHRPGLVGLIDKVVHLKVSAPPADGQANRELCNFLAELFHLAPSLISVRYGHSARQKVVEVQGVDEGHLFAILRQHLVKNMRE